MSGDGAAIATHRARLRSAIRKLDALDQRRATLLHERDAAILRLSAAGLSFSEIATLCGLSRGRIGQIVQRGSAAQTPEH